MDTGFLNSLVADYLTSVSSKLAEKFKKETKSAPLPEGSPRIAEMVKHFKENTPKASKRKLGMTNGDSAAKKAKKDDSSSDDSSEDEDDNKNKKPVANGKPAKAAPVEKMEESSDDSDSEEEEPAKPAAKPVAASKAAAKKEESSSEDSDSDEENEKPAAKPAAKAAAKPAAAAKKDESSSDDDSDSDDEDAKPAAKTAIPAKPAAKPAAAKESSSDEDSSDEEEAPAAKKAAPAPVAKKATAKEESSSDDDSSDEEEEKPATKPVAKPAAAKEESSDDSDSDSEDEKPAPKAVKSAAKPAKKEESSDDSSDDSSDEEEESTVKKAQKPAPAEPMDEDDGMVVKSNKNKTIDDLKTPTKGHDKSFGDKSFSEEGRKIFIHNVSEESTYEDFQEAVEKHGEVTDFFNPGRGFAFITYSTAEEAQACIKAMDNTEVGGRSIQMNIARPKGEKPAPGTGGKRQEAPEGCKLFVHGITQETDNYSLKTAFEAHGTVTDAYNPGKGFAFVTYSKPAEAQAAIAAMEGTEVCGCYVTINVAKPRGGGDTPGGRGGRGGKAGGGGRREEVEGAKLFVHNVSEDTAQEDLWNAFAEHGTVTDAYNPGRGFAFVTFASAEDAQKAMNALEGQEVCGREIQCNVAKPREQKDGGGRGGRGGARGGGRGGRGGRGGARGGKGMSINVGGGGNNKKISFD